MLGTGAAALVAATQSRVCHNDRGEEVDCRSSGTRSGGSSAFRIVGPSLFGFQGSQPSRTAQPAVSRGGFGSTGHGHSGG